ncbi:hypothetical protein JCM3766R1_002514 [Sporobolomyces carnicolor]
MMTTRRLSGMPQQSNQQFGIMLDTYEAFRKKHQAQNKEIITKNSELHKTNAELLQHRSVIQAQNLSLKGTLLETEAELLSIKDRLYRAQESERDLREQLDRFVSRCACAAGSSDASPSVNREQVEMMRHALATAMTALHAFQSALDNPSSGAARSQPRPIDEAPPVLARTRAVPTTRSRKVSLADRPGAMTLSNRLLVAETPDLSLIDEVESLHEIDDDGGGGEDENFESVRTRRGVPALPLPLPIPTTNLGGQTSTVSSGTLRGSPNLPVANSTTTIPAVTASTTSKPDQPPRRGRAAAANRDLLAVEDANRSQASVVMVAARARPVPIAKSLQPRSTTTASTIAHVEGEAGRRAATARQKSVLSQQPEDDEGQQSSPKPVPADEEEGRGQDFENTRTMDHHGRGGGGGAVERVRTARRKSILPTEPSAPETVHLDAEERDDVSTVTPGSALLEARKQSIKQQLASSTSSSSRTSPPPLREVTNKSPPLSGHDCSIGARPDPRTTTTMRTRRSETPPIASLTVAQTLVIEPEPIAVTALESSSAEAEQEPLDRRRARKSVNYALPKLNTKMRRPDDYVPVTSSASSSSHHGSSHKPRKSTKLGAAAAAVAPRRDSTSVAASNSTSTSTSTSTTTSIGGKSDPLASDRDSNASSSSSSATVAAATAALPRGGGGVSGGTRQPSLAGKVSKRPLPTVAKPELVASRSAAAATGAGRKLSSSSSSSGGGGSGAALPRRVENDSEHDDDTGGEEEEEEEDDEEEEERVSDDDDEDEDDEWNEKKFLESLANDHHHPRHHDRSNSTTTTTAARSGTTVGAGRGASSRALGPERKRRTSQQHILA